MQSRYHKAACAVITATALLMLISALVGLGVLQQFSPRYSMEERLDVLVTARPEFHVLADSQVLKMARIHDAGDVMIASSIRFACGSVVAASLILLVARAFLFVGQRKMEKTLQNQPVDFTG